MQVVVLRGSHALTAYLSSPFSALVVPLSLELGRRDPAAPASKHGMSTAFSVTVAVAWPGMGLPSFELRSD